MIELKGGTFLMGTDSNEGLPADGEGPVREATIASFYMDKTAVTNAQFAEFVRETNYKTEAERFGWSYVFHNFIPEQKKASLLAPDDTPWWLGVEKAW